MEFLSPGIFFQCLTPVLFHTFSQSVTERSRKQRKKDQKSDKKKTEKKLEQTAESRTGRDSKVRRSRSNSPRKSGKGCDFLIDVHSSLGHADTCM